MTAALIEGKVAKYVTDFPNEVILRAPNVIAMPHLGACTPESEDRCAEMAANEMMDYLINGNIRNSVNLPDIYLNRVGACRLCVIHRNVEHMINKNRGKFAVTIVDLGSAIYEETVNGIREMDEVVRVRVI